MKNKFYITTPIYYANAKPHIGHAYTSIAADVLTRWNKQQGKKTFLLMGTDEHGLKIQKKAEEAGKDPQQFVDEIAEEFKSLCGKLNINYDNFIRTTDRKHKETVQKVLQSLYDKGVIYKGTYEGLYCVGCEQFKNKSDLVDGKCPDHNTKPEIVKEESYLLKMEEIQPQLIEKIKSDEFKIAPQKRKNEILSFLENNKLKDISISRKNVFWGIPLPFDKNYTTYVWVDAFLNYLTGIGWSGSGEQLAFSELSDMKWWPPDVQLIGKDILRVHATIWPAILIHLGIELPKQIFVHGHILSEGKKMSKTLGNVIGIDEMLKKFGTDGTRYLLMSAGSFGEDIDMTMKRMVEKYNADLANGLGNLTSRILKLGSISNFQFLVSIQIPIANKQFSKKIDKLELDKALEYIWKVIRDDNKYIEDNKPWELVKTDRKKFEKIMEKLALDLYVISELLVPFMPKTAEKIKKALENNEPIILFERVK